MIEQISAEVVEEEIGHDDGCDIRPSGKAFFQVQSYVVGFLSLFGIFSLPPVPLFHWPFSVWRCSVFSSHSTLYLANLIQGWLRGEDRTRTRQSRYKGEQEEKTEQT